MNPLVKKAVVAVAAKQAFDKVMEKRQESRSRSLTRFAPFALAGLGGVLAFLFYRSRQTT
ncbi:MAG: hypothetical protein M3285_04830 [Actinomycetota bacterium]|nr:hypothetical protein [Actinomycetota bacterium]